MRKKRIEVRVDGDDWGRSKNREAIEKNGKLYESVITKESMGWHERYWSKWREVVVMKWWEVRMMMGSEMTWCEKGWARGCVYWCMKTTEILDSIWAVEGFKQVRMRVSQSEDCDKRWWLWHEASRREKRADLCREVRLYRIYNKLMYT